MLSPIQYSRNPTDMKHGRCELNVSEVSGALFWALFTSLAVVLAIYRTQARVIHTFGSRALPLFILCISDVKHLLQYKIVRGVSLRGSELPYHCLWVFNVHDTHPLYILGRKEAKLNLFHRAQRRLREGEKDVRHGCGDKMKKVKVIGIEESSAEAR